MRGREEQAQPREREQRQRHGHAGQLIAFALADIQRSGRRVLPTCWFVAQFIDDHPEYADLVAGRPGS